MEKRKQAAEQAKANRDKAKANAPGDDAENTSALDSLLEKLRNGDNVGRKARRTRASAANRPSTPLDLSAASLLASSGRTDTVDIARDMLARLKSDGFEALVPTSPTASTAPRRTRRRIRGISEDLEGSPLLQMDGMSVDGEPPMSPLSSVDEQLHTAGESDTEVAAPTEADTVDTLEAASEADTTITATTVVADDPQTT